MVLQICDLLVEDGGERLRRQRLISDDAIDAVDEFRREALPHGHQRDVLQLAGEIGALGRFHGLEAEIRIDFAHHLARAEVAGEKHQALFEIDDGVVAQPQNPLVEHAEQQAGHGRRGLLDFVEQDQGQVALLGGDTVQLLLGEHGLRFAMPQVAGRRADQLGYLVLHLELAAVDLEDVFFGAMQDVGEGFDRLGLAGAGGTQQQEDADRPALGGEPGLVHLDVGDDDPRGSRLPDDLLG